MTSASALFCGRRMRRNRTSDALAFDSFSETTGTSADSSHGRRRQRTNHHSQSRHRLTLDDYDDSRRPSHGLRSCSRSAITGGCISVQLDGGASESSSGSVINPSTINNHDENNRLPRAVLFARERLLRRLGVSSGTREASSGTQHDDVWLVDAGDWETSIPTDRLPGSSFWIESPSSGANAHPLLQESRKKPAGLTMDAFVSLHHEAFMEVEGSDEDKLVKSSDDCSICLENFVGGNKVINLPCHHTFHPSCLYPWVQTCGECPYCRTAISV
ncbi:hypothetical protein Dimus_026403 [Dionaea muscipula]